MLLEKGRALLLQGQVLRPQPGNSRGRVLSPTQGLGHNAPHGAPELLFDLLQPGHLLIDAPAAGLRLGCTALLVLLKALPRRAHNLAVVCHMSAPFVPDSMLLSVYIKKVSRSLCPQTQNTAFVGQGPCALP